MATVRRLRDDEAVASTGPTFASTFADVKKQVTPPLDVLVDACVSTLSRPTAATATTAIQAECWAVLLRQSTATDVIGISPTGSGKTLAFLLPAFASMLQADPSETRAVAEAPAAAQSTAAEDPAVAKERAEAAMRATATSAFAEAVKTGMSKDQAKEFARKQAKAAYKEALKAPAPDGTKGPQTTVVQDKPQPGGGSATEPEGVPLAPDAAAPSVLVLAPTRELCLQISAVCEAIVESLITSLGEKHSSVVASGCVVGGVDFNRQRQAILGQRPRLLVATPGRLLSQCGVVPASSQARAAAAEDRGEPTSNAGTEFLPGRGSIAARRKLAARLAAEGKLPAPAPLTEAGVGDSHTANTAAVDLRRVSILVLDEADRLLDLGFEADLRMALSLLRTPSAVRQRTLLFSATFSAPIRALAAELLEPSALRITVERPQQARAALQQAPTEGGDAASELTSSASVVQRFEIHRGKGAKAVARRRLLALLRDHLGEEEEDDDEEEDEEEADRHDAEDEAEDAAGGDDEERVGQQGVAAIDIGDAGGDEDDNRPRVIVFALYKLEARQLADLLVAKGLPAVALHGDMPQKARSEAMAAFRSGEARILVATDVAARGLDVRHVTAVINTSLGMSLENYVHRVGRCGRAGATGTATTFLVDGDEALVPSLVALLERSRQAVPPEMRDLVRKLEADAARNAKTEARAQNMGDDDDEEEDERTQMQIANREKQLARQKAKKSKEMKKGSGGRR